MPNWTCRIPVRRASALARLEVSCQDARPKESSPNSAKQTQFTSFWAQKRRFDEKTKPIGPVWRARTAASGEQDKNAKQTQFAGEANRRISFFDNLLDENQVRWQRFKTNPIHPTTSTVLFLGNSIQAP